MLIFLWPKYVGGQASSAPSHSTLWSGPGPKFRVWVWGWSPWQEDWKIPPASTMIRLKLCGIQLRFRLYSSSVCESMIVFLEQMMRDLGGRSKILGRDWPFQNKEKKLIEILLTNNYLPKTIETLWFVFFLVDCVTQLKLYTFDKLSSLIFCCLWVC